MAENPDLRNRVDSYLAKFGIDYRDLQDIWTGGGWGPRNKLEQWARANRNDPMSDYILNNTSEFLNNLTGAVRGLRSGGDISSYVSALDAAAGPARQFEGSANGAPLANPAPSAEDQAAAAKMKQRQGLTDWITKFTQSMGGTPDMSDPVFRGLTNAGMAAGSSQAGQNGIRVGRGGLGELAIAQSAQNAALPYLQQRRQMELQGLGLLNNREATNEQLDQSAYRLDLQAQDMQNNMAGQDWARRDNEALANGQSLGSTLGGIGGAVVGGIATAATGGAAAPLIPGLIQGGSSLGAGWGGASVTRPQMPKMKPYRPYTSGR
jgi:hypothetical protein